MVMKIPESWGVKGNVHFLRLKGMKILRDSLIDFIRFWQNLVRFLGLFVRFVGNHGIHAMK